VITGWEWVVILLVVVVIIIWGPKKVPELARAIGRARGEFERASREYATPAPPPETPQAKKEVSSDDMLILIAKGLGINTEGKSKEEIFQEIIANIKTSKEAGS